MNKIEKASTEIIIFRENHLYPPDIKTESENIWLLQYRRLLVGFQLNLRYLTHLVRNKDIKTKHLVNYCRYDAIHYLGQLNQHYIRLEREYSEFAKKEIIGAGFHEEVLDLEEFWKDIGISRWHKIFRYKKRKRIGQIRSYEPHNPILLIILFHFIFITNMILTLVSDL